ncbi:helix-turn-helix domain-containing protein [Cellulosimicrobium cellulans]|uniref:helix-turn-helix domain-containing protein n=1 Tax=Cellulosimicrobium cellulans TaxID=1710 RepID=UPI002404B106|nr:helix-turn-helix transcriptional regulator [Cellulosimicrobium cellulans]MDF9877683.1 transcriptional regulator with XRE-family HTH domain [Cellulosimicrobium cellulans]
MAEPVTAGELLRRARKERQESLRDAAATIDVAPSHLSRLERGQKRASNELLHRAARHYGLDPGLLLDPAVPQDVVEILEQHPELVDEIRKRYAPK